MKLWWVETREKIECIISSVYFALRKFCTVCILSQCREYWIKFQNTSTFIYQKTLLHILSWMILKWSKEFGASLYYVEAKKSEGSSLNFEMMN